MATIKRIAGSSASLTTTADLNSLADAASVLLDEYNNATNLWPSADFEFTLDYGTNPTENSLFELWLIPAWDGTNYADGTASVPARANLSIGGLLVRATTDAQRLVLRDIPIPACKFKILAKNSTGQTTAATGCEAAIFPHGLQSV